MSSSRRSSDLDPCHSGWPAVSVAVGTKATRSSPPSATGGLSSTPRYALSGSNYEGAVIAGAMYVVEDLGDVNPPSQLWPVMGDQEAI